MCGISCTLLRKDNAVRDQTRESHQDLIKNRGPDGFSEIEIEMLCDWRGKFAGSTLWTQGSYVLKQPLIAPNGSVFLWNGDKYSDLSTNDAEDNQENENDSEEVFSRILSHGVSYLTSICGPYSFIYYDMTEKELWFGRDVLGRHSLLWGITQNAINLSSVGSSIQSNYKFTEVPSCGLFKIALSVSSTALEMHPWTHAMTPSDIQITIPIVIKEKLKHETLTMRFGSSWLNEEPEIPDFIQNPGKLSESNTFSTFQRASDHSLFATIIADLKHLLFESVKKRIVTKPMFCRNCILSKQRCEHSKIGILFSGGLDSAILALIANTFVDDGEPIDLYNVAFQRTAQHKFNNVPDRINGRNTLEELKSLCPNRIWNFVEINISPEELSEERNNHISKLISPLTSILDDSLGCALWFAARGKGLLHGNVYTSPARVVLLGMGADELFGGYTKHRKVFMSEGWGGLGKELCASISSIGERNLGRDNRVVADHGRQPRTPYLDEKVVSYVDSLPPWQRCFLYPHVPIGTGDKFILRLLAWNLGLRGASVLPKKALQFGSQIANPKEKGHMTSERLS